MPRLRDTFTLLLLCSVLPGCAVSWRGDLDPPPPGASLPGAPLFDAVAIDGTRVRTDSSLSFATPAQLFAALERSGLYAPGSGLGRTLDLTVTTRFNDAGMIQCYLSISALPGFAWNTATVSGFVSQEGRLLFEGGHYDADTTEMTWLLLILWPPSLYRAFADGAHREWKQESRTDACLRALESLLAELELHRNEIELASARPSAPKKPTAAPSVTPPAAAPPSIGGR